jgi:hypothetical protein
VVGGGGGGIAESKLPGVGMPLIKFIEMKFVIKIIIKAILCLLLV